MSSNNNTTREYESVVKRQYVPPEVDLNEMPEKQFAVIRRVACSYVCRRESDRGRVARFQSVESVKSAQEVQNGQTQQPNAFDRPTLAMTITKRAAARIKRINRKLEAQGLPEKLVLKKIRVPMHALVMLSQSIRALNPADIVETLIGNGKNGRTSQFNTL